jgi:hypothetical protein
VKDVVEKRKGKKEICVKNLIFDEFSKLIVAEQIIAFYIDINILFYNIKNIIRYLIRNERV